MVAIGYGALMHNVEKTLREQQSGAHTIRDNVRIIEELRELYK